MEQHTDVLDDCEDELLIQQRLEAEEERQRFSICLMAGAAGTFALALAVFWLKGWQAALPGVVFAALQLVVRHYGCKPENKALLGWLKQIVLSCYLVAIVVLSLFTGQGQSFVLWFLVLLPVMAAFVNTPPTAGLWAALATLAALGVWMSAHWVILPERFFTTPELRDITRLVLILIVAAICLRVRQTSDVRIRQLSQSLHQESHSRRNAEQMQQAAEQAQRAAEEAGQAKTRFLAFMSHEIRTPLSGVLGLNALLRETPLTPEQLKFVDLASHSGEVLLNLINDFLDFSRLDAQRLELESLVFDPCWLLHDKVLILQESALQKGLALSCECSAPRGVRGDRTRVGQILLNLAGNAIKFTAAGSVTLRCRELAGTAQQAWLRFEVEDTGIGIAPALRESLFQPFVQADASTTRRYGGTGLGLAICKLLAEAMDGRIGVESTPGRGSLFWVELPFGRVPEAEWPAAPAAGPDEAGLPRIPGSAGRVLLVEDNSVNQLMAAEILKRLGYRVEVASNGQEAVDALQQQAFDVVFMDCDMPVMDGFEATRAIRAQEAPGQHVPIIAMTAAALPGDRERCLAAGMDDYLAKPVRLADLGRTVSRWLGAGKRA